MSSAHEAAVDALMRQPFPDIAYGRRDAFGDVDHHVARLSVTQDFWDDRGEEVVGPVRDAIEQERDRLAEAFSKRWGPAEEVNFWGDGEHRNPADLEDGEAVDFFRSQTSGMLAWSCPEHNQWVALAVIQADPELPFALFVAVGAGSAWSATGSSGLDRG
ncbi:hypothetical protein BJ973_005743 [Actinoplanes tereljensis]|uniref:Uncharacterized protein n=1 Tax=Paractinoplanes tereljensis TaxID=571912 RepID=A0A919NXW8_9ACTN|nr:hypothetical protein [Actinoplanes tereljensis]GIF26383.1 hypothetical protein Ate02nite_91130 [Actinoplanes tereljensis]